MVNERFDSLKCVVSGSIRKYKPEIDLAIDALTDYGVLVLAPEKGWFYMSPQFVDISKLNFRPLPNEIGMSVRQIEDSFLASLKNSDFVYVVNPDGIVGNSVSMEIGAAIFLGIPIYSQKPIPIAQEVDPLWKEVISSIKSISIQEMMAELKEK